MILISLFDINHFFAHSINGFNIAISAELTFSHRLQEHRIGLDTCLPHDQLKNTFGTNITLLGLDMTTCLIGLSLSHCPSKLVRAKVEC